MLAASLVETCVFLHKSVLKFIAFSVFALLVRTGGSTGVG